MRKDGRPHIISEGFKAKPLERIKLGGRDIKEDYLQEMLDANPEILPVRKLDDSFSFFPIASLGREIMNIDNLFISPSGRLTLVETKLWRNPQAVREVLAQIVDYATRLAKMDYATLEEQFRSASRCPVGEGGLYEFVRQFFAGEVPDEPRFTDNVTRDLRNGRFLLLVVGDGIQEGLERMLSAIHLHSGMHFRFGLIEMRLYSAADHNGVLAIPSVVCHATEIERAVVTVRRDDRSEISVNVETNLEKEAPYLTEKEFLAEMRTDAAREFCRKILDWGRDIGEINFVKGSVAIRVPFSTTVKGIVLMRIYPTGAVAVTPPHFRLTLRKAGYDDQLAVDLALELKRIFPEITVRPEKSNPITSIPAERLLKRLNEVTRVYEDMVHRLTELSPAPISDLQNADEDDELDDEL